MLNKDIVKKILTSGLKKWQVAEAIGIADTTFSKWLRHELPEEKKAAIIMAIDKLADERRAI
ncbi:MAG TPA: hypothetical protein PKA10_19720 [Selenomonadales bacterium]|nr:hypothetical protein [Selenomonadales bacterium]